MQVAYVDDSSTHDGAKITCLCGFVADESVWLDFDGRWQTALAKSEWPSALSEFHMHDCVHGEEEFIAWTYAQRLALFGDLCTVIAGSNIRAVGSAIIPAHLAELPVDDLQLLKAESLSDPLDFVFQLLIQQIIHRTAEYSATEKVGVVYDNSDWQREQRFHVLHHDYRANFISGERLSEATFASGKDWTPLQAADLLAYSTYRLAMENHFPEGTEPHFPIIPAFARILENVANGGGIYAKENLQRLLLRIKAKDQSLIGRRKAPPILP